MKPDTKEMTTLQAKLYKTDAVIKRLERRVENLENKISRNQEKETGVRIARMIGESTCSKKV